MIYLHCEIIYLYVKCQHTEMIVRHWLVLLSILALIKD